jgi:hypothetical protein
MPCFSERGYREEPHDQAHERAADHSRRILCVYARVSDEIYREHEKHRPDGLIPDNAGGPRYFRNDVLREPLCVVDVCVPIHKSKRVRKLHHVYMLAPGTSQAVRV